MRHSQFRFQRLDPSVEVAHPLLHVATLQLQKLKLIGRGKIRVRLLRLVDRFSFLFVRSWQVSSILRTRRRRRHEKTHDTDASNNPLMLNMIALPLAHVCARPIENAFVIAE